MDGLRQHPGLPAQGLRLAGQPPDCQIAEFGCTEWSGLSRFIYFAVGIVDLVVYMIWGVILLLRNRWQQNASPQ